MNNIRANFFQFIWKLIVRLAAGLTAGATLILLIMAIFLYYGPISLNFLSPLIERSLTLDDSKFRVNLKNIEVDFNSFKGNISIVSENVNILDPEN